MLNVPVAAIKAVAEVESSGSGFLSDGRVRILFERHKFALYSEGQYSADYPDLSNRKAGGYSDAEGEYERFSRAFQLDDEAAMKSASWGKFQIMGFNHELAGFASVGLFVDAMKVSEREHLLAFVSFVKLTYLARFIKAKDWAGFAAGYNGAQYKRNNYDKKMAAAYERFSSQPEAPTAEVPLTEKLLLELEVTLTRHGNSLAELGKSFAALKAHLQGK